MESEGQKRNFPAEMPEEVHRQVISNKVNVFCAKTTFRKSQVKSDNEFKVDPLVVHAHVFACWCGWV
jgi:hypothetical protein